MPQKISAKTSKVYLILHDGKNVLVGAGGKTTRSKQLVDRLGIHLPGGTVDIDDVGSDDNNTSMNTAANECLEETGIKIDVTNVSLRKNKNIIPSITLDTAYIMLPHKLIQTNSAYFVVIQINQSCQFDQLLLKWKRQPTFQLADESFTAVCAVPFLIAKTVFLANANSMTPTDWFAEGLRVAKLVP